MQNRTEAMGGKWLLNLFPNGIRPEEIEALKKNPNVLEVREKPFAADNRVQTAGL